MAFRGRRRGSGIGRGGVLALLAGAAIIFAALWLGPMRPLPAELQLLALTADGSFAAAVRPVVEGPDEVAAVGDVVARAPLLLAVQNVGARPTRPRSVRISVPARFRLTGPGGDALPTHSAPGTPLVQYDLALDVPQLRPGDVPTLLPGLDTLWIEAVLPQYHCSFIADGVPEFVPSPQYDPGTLAEARLFYAFEIDRGERHTGLLTVHFDPTRLTREAVPTPARAAVSVHPDAAPRPDLGPLTQVGTRSAQCGDPEAPIALHTVLWEGESGSLMYEVHVDDRPRKLVYDLNRDGRVDIEIWDAEGDGGFRARRETAYVLPNFLRPLPDRVAVLAEAVPVDSAWLQRFYAVHDGPYRFGSPPRTIVADAPGAPAAPPSAMPPARPPAVIAQPVDSAWLQRFLDAESGPFRFAAAQPTQPQPMQPAPQPGQPPVAGGTAATDSPAVVAADSPAAAPPPAASPRPAPRLLGRPVPWPPPDSLR